MNENELKVGKRVRWNRGPDDVRTVPVRTVGDPNGGWAGHAKVDDGDKDNPDIMTNGFGD
jgi:hypothetical protein